MLAKPQNDEPSVVPVSAPSPLRLRWLWPGVATLAITGALGLSFVHFREAPPVTPLVQTDMPLPEGVVPGYGSLSPDGTKLVVRGTPPGGRPQLYLRPLGARAFAPVPGTEDVAVQPFWSPDSQWIAFGAGGKLRKWNVTSGQPPQIVCNADVNYGSWGDDGVILFSEDGKPIQRVPAMGGTPRNALELDSAFGEQSHNGPSFLPGGKAFLFTSNGKIRGATFFATLDGKVRRHLFDNTYGLNVYVANPSGGGFLAYTERFQLLARPFNPATGEFLGEAVLLVDGVVNGPTFSFGGPGYLAYTPTQTVSTQLHYYGGDGKPGEILGEPGELASPQLSPDGKRVMFGKRNSGKYEIWVSGETGASEPIAGDTVPLVAIWTPDGRIIYSRREAQENVVIERPADALGAESILGRIPGNAGATVRNISANGKVIALSSAGGGRNETSLLSRPGGNVRPANSPSPHGLGVSSIARRPLVDVGCRSVSLPRIRPGCSGRPGAIAARRTRNCLDRYEDRRPSLERGRQGDPLLNGTDDGTKGDDVASHRLERWHSSRWRRAKTIRCPPCRQLRRNHRWPPLHRRGILEREHDFAYSPRPELVHSAAQVDARSCS